MDAEQSGPSSLKDGGTEAGPKEKRQCGVALLLAEVFTEEGSRECRLYSPELSAMSRVSLTSPRVLYTEKTLRNQTCLPKLPPPVKQHLMSHHPVPATRVVSGWGGVDAKAHSSLQGALGL